MRGVEARASVPVEPGALFARLADLENHWDLADRWVEVVSLNGSADGGVVRLHGPLGLSRTASTTVERVEQPRLIEGSARIGSTTVGRVRWELVSDGDGGEVTRVSLRAELVEAGSLDRALWALGGRVWLRSRLRLTLARLAQLHAGDVDPDQG